MTIPASVSSYIQGPRHVGVVAADGTATVSRLQAIFGLKDTDITCVPEDPAAPADTRFWFFSIGGLPYEVIEPVSAHFRALLLRDGDGSNTGMNHVCYNVRDLPAAVAAMQAVGVRCGHVTPTGMVELPRFRMAYFNPEDTGGLLIEFVEEFSPEDDTGLPSK